MIDAAKARSITRVRTELRSLEDDPSKGLPWTLTVAATTVRLAAQGIVPEQVRILNNGVVVAISARALESSGEGDDGFTIRMSEYIAVALAAAQPGFRVEALIDERWLPVELRTGDAVEIRTTEVRDKRGRAYRMPVEDRPFAVITLPLARTS